MAELLVEVQDYLAKYDNVKAATQFMSKMTTPGTDSKVGEITEAVALMRMTYNDGSSTRIHSSSPFNDFLSAFLKANASEIMPRVIAFAEEKLVAERAEAITELNGLNLLPLPEIISALTKAGTTAAALSYQLESMYSHTYPVTYAIAGDSPSQLPTGLTLNTATGLVSGTATETGTFNVTFVASNAYGTARATVVFTIS